MECKVYKVYKVPNDKLDGEEDFLDSFPNQSEAIDFAEEERELTSCNVWVVLVGEESGYFRVVSI